MTVSAIIVSKGEPARLSSNPVIGARHDEKTRWHTQKRPRVAQPAKWGERPHSSGHPCGESFFPCEGLSRENYRRPFDPLKDFTLSSKGTY
jgi:hypothetical protein